MGRYLFFIVIFTAVEEMPTVGTEDNNGRYGMTIRLNNICIYIYTYKTTVVLARCRRSLFFFFFLGGGGGNSPRDDRLFLFYFLSLDFGSTIYACVSLVTRKTCADKWATEFPSTFVCDSIETCSFDRLV